ncbi:hypothetical protein ABPG77_005812 [Micractinium sp. CCAP 211/92]
MACVEQGKDGTQPALAIAKDAVTTEEQLPEVKYEDSSAAACSPFFAPAKAASSQRSAGTVSGGAPEVAQQSRRGTAAAAASATASLKRPLSSLDLGGLDLDQDSQTSSQGYSKSARSSREATPARQRAAAQRARAAWADSGRGDESGDEAGSDLDSRSGLDFLLKACEMLDPHAAASAAAHAASLPTPVKRPALAASAEGTQRVTRPLRAASVEASPSALPRRPVSRRLLAKEAAEQDGDYVPEADSEWEGSVGGDADYQPSGRPARTSTRAQRASARGVAAVTASAAAAAALLGGEEAAAPAAPAPVRGRWGGEPKQLITGPCMNPECEHPFESPQWRKGPPQHPVLCNACGTRWLRNGTLKPLVPRRGLRYKNKPKPPPKGKAAAAGATAAQVAASLPPLPATLQLVTGPQPAASSDASGGGRSASEADDPAALFPHSRAASLQLPIPPLQAALPSFVPPAAALPVAFNPAAMFGGLDPGAAAAAAAAAFQAAPQMFAGGGSPVLAPWGFFAQPAAPPPALFQPSPVLKQQEPADATASEAGLAGGMQQQPSLQSELAAV